MKNQRLLSLSSSNSDLEGDPDTDLISNKYDAASIIIHVTLHYRYMEEEAINCPEEIKKFLIWRYNLGLWSFFFK